MRERETKLLPCPFCGGNAEIITGDESAYVQCLDMKMHRALWFSGDNNAAGEVAEQWNRRAAAPDLAEALAEAREVIAGLQDTTWGNLPILDKIDAALSRARGE